MEYWGGVMGVLAFRLEGQYAPLLCHLHANLRVKLALHEDAEQLAAMVPVFNLRMVVAGYLPGGNEPGTLQFLERAQRIRPWGEIPLVVAVHDEHVAAFEDELCLTRLPPGRYTTLAQERWLDEGLPGEIRRQMLAVGYAYTAEFSCEAAFDLE